VMSIIFCDDTVMSIIFCDDTVMSIIFCDGVHYTIGEAASCAAHVDGISCLS